MQRSEIHNYLIWIYTFICSINIHQHFIFCWICTRNCFFVVVVEEKKENIPRVFLSDDQNYEHNFFKWTCFSKKLRQNIAFYFTINSIFRAMCQCFTSSCQIIYMNVVRSDIKHHISLHHKTVCKLLSLVYCGTPYPGFPPLFSCCNRTFTM